MLDMKVKLIPIGNSKGVRIPASIIRECGLEGELDLEVREGGVLIKPSANPRAGWEAAIQRSSQPPSANEELLIPDDLENEFDETEWTW